MDLAETAEMPSTKGILRVLNTNVVQISLCLMMEGKEIK